MVIIPDNWIDLTKLHTYKNKGKYYIDWEHSENDECSFLFDGIQGKIKIIDTSNYKENGHLIILYNDEEYDTHYMNLKCCRLKKIVFKYGKFKYEIGETICDDSKNITIFDREFREKHSHNKFYEDYINHDKYYYVRCNKCKHEYWIIESSIYSKRKITCPACGKNPKYVVKGINDITTTTPWMIPYFQGGYDEASKYIKTSREKPGLVCPFCKRINYKQQIQDLYRRKKVHCICNDGFSYPNKFINCLFEQLYNSNQIIYMEREKRFDWSQNRIYDMYAITSSGERVLCENQGNFHYNPKRISERARTLEEEQENDVLKKELAIKNNIMYYVQLDCRKSDMNWIKQSIINSKLNDIFDLSVIDFGQCEKFALGNLLFDVCNYKNNNETTIKELSNIFNISIDSVKKYIKSGKELGLCS